MLDFGDGAQRSRRERVLAPVAVGGAGRLGARRARPLPGGGGARRSRAAGGRRACCASSARHVGDTGRTPFTVALTHDVDIPWRWSRPRALLGAAARARGAARARHPRDAAAEALGLAAAPVRRLRGTDPNWSYERIAAIERAPRRPLDVLRHGRPPRRGRRPRSGGLRPAAPGHRGPDRRAGRRGRPAPELHGLGAARAHRRGAGAAGAADRRRRAPACGSTTCATTPTRPCPSSSGSASPTTRARATATRSACGPGFSFPYRPYHLAAGPAARPGRAAAGGDGRDPGRAALPGAHARRRPRAHAAAARAGGRRRRHGRRSCGTPTASAASTRAAGTASTTRVLEWVAGRGGRLVTAAEAVAPASASGRARAGGGGATTPVRPARAPQAAPGRRWPAWPSARARPGGAAAAARCRPSARGRGGA